MRQSMGARGAVWVGVVLTVLSARAGSAASGPRPLTHPVFQPPPASAKPLPAPAACTSETYLYAGVWSPAEIHVYCVAASGTLTALGVVAAPGDVRDLQVSPSGQSLFYADADLTEYSIAVDGSLALVGTSAVGFGTFFDLALDPSDPSGQMLYGTHSKDSGGVYVYDTQGTLPALVQTVSGLYLPRGIAVRPAGNLVHVANGYPQEIHSYPLLANGRLNTAPMQLTSFEPRAHLFAIPSGLPLLYWTESPGGSVLTGSVNGAGAVTLTDSIFSGFGATALVLDAAGDHLYVVQNNTDDVAVYEISGSGELAFEQLADTERRPEHLALHPSGSFLYVASAGNLADSSKITLYVVAADGHLSSLGVAATLQQGVYRLAIAQP